MGTRTHVLWGTYTSVEEVDWQALYNEYLPRVYNFFCYRVGDKPLAEDLTAATFEKAWRNRVHYRRDLSAFSTWLFTIARNVAADYFRGGRREIPFEAGCDQVDPDLPEETVQRKHDFAQLNALLSRLPVRERELIALKYGTRLTNREIAKLIHLSESNVGTILHRVVEKLRGELEAES